MNDALKEAAREAYALAPSNVAVLDTLELSHSVAGHLYLVKNTEDLTLTLEDESTHLFTATAFELALPSDGATGIQELQIAVDNIDRAASDYVFAAAATREPIIAKYRPYLSSDLTQPQLDPPLILTLTDVTVDESKVTAIATFYDLLNRYYLTQNYTRSRFPSLGQGA